MLEYPFNNPNSCISSCINKHIISEFIWFTIIWISAAFPRQYDTLTHYAPLYFISQKIFYSFLNFIFNWKIITVLWWFLPYIKMNSMWTILKVFIDLLQYCFHFFFFSCHEACGILDPQPEMVPDRPASEGDVSTTGPPGRSPCTILNGFPWEEFHLYLKIVLV